MDRVSFLLNGVPCSVGHEVSSNLSLLEYIRVHKELRSTKYMCREGGCGSCMVAVARPGERTHAVNSCLVSVTSCQDWEITTIEDIGNRLKGYHPLQTTLAKLNGTQCGYCSPGWVMAMYGLLLQNKEKLTMLEIEKSLGSNICRCTGYRPILEAFKKFASDAPREDILDIEELTICKKNGEACRKSKCSESDWCLVVAEDLKLPERIEFQLRDGKFWFRVQSVADIFEVLRKKGEDSYMLVNGNTAKGAYPIIEYPQLLIDISNVQELKGFQIDQNLVLGAGNTLTETMDIFEQVTNSLGSFWYLEKLREHLMLVAHIPVRNLGTIAGNLMIKHQHNEFQSDIFLLFETVGAYLTIVDQNGMHIVVTPEEFLQVDMKGKVILNILLPPLSRSYKFVSFKIMPRSLNAHAIVNAAFLYKICDPQDHVCLARMVYGGLSPHFVHANNTEKFLIGRQLFSNDTLQSAIKVLLQDLVVEDCPPEPSAKYRRDLAVNLFYKGLLSLCPSSTVSPKYESGGIVLSKTRPVSNGRQFVDTNPLLWPLTQPIQKVEALIQCAGEAPYTEDLPELPREVFGEFVLATIPVGEIKHIDASEALKYSGVVAFYSAKDIPGVNSFTPGDMSFFFALEELFCSGPVKYNGQVVGIVVAETRPIAEYAAKLVKITYKNVKKPVIDVKVAKTDPNRIILGQAMPATSRGTDINTVIKGDETIYQQTHFCMEVLVSVAKPTEEGLELHCTTQHMDGIQFMVSRVLKMQENKIDVHVRRLGGAYGIKISRGNQVAVASALVAYKLNRPCRIILSLETQSHAIGKRLPCSTDFEVAVDATGRIQYCNENLYTDNGYVLDEPLFMGTFDVYNNCYEKARFDYKVFNVITDTASNSWCRSPAFFRNTGSYSVSRIHLGAHCIRVITRPYRS
ncbi:probable aldehyde oxidase 4 [Leguminivora glycinivorella]|uniref:probable aldehyde oxidase 4 n=1 Tax=Leguminivora glycinivorella TaxID=1035111 RepID=UPI0020109379|nr:probable aldehyde oxidase 4 [Leguminivora glycinivorella]